MTPTPPIYMHLAREASKPGTYCGLIGAMHTTDGRRWADCPKCIEAYEKELPDAVAESVSRATGWMLRRLRDEPSAPGVSLAFAELGEEVAQAFIGGVESVETPLPELPEVSAPRGGVDFPDFSLPTSMLPEIEAELVHEESFGELLDSPSMTEPLPRLDHSWRDRDLRVTVEWWHVSDNPTRYEYRIAGTGMSVREENVPSYGACYSWHCKDCPGMGLPAQCSAQTRIEDAWRHYVEAHVVGPIGGSTMRERDRRLAGMERDPLRDAVAAVLTNSANYPEPLQARMLGLDMSGLIERVTTAVREVRS